jgi:membrane protease YdiL (CAAX protease family)
VRTTLVRSPDDCDDARVRMWVREHAVVSYVVLAYALSWSWWIPMAIRGDVVRDGIGWPTHLPGLLGPALAAVAVTAVADGRAGLGELWSRWTRWRVGWGWWLLVFGTAALAVLGVVVPLVLAAPVPEAAAFGRYSGIAEIGLPGTAAVALVVNGFGEEAGWRGFAADRLLDRHGLRGTAVIVAAVWAGWHLPLFWIVESFRTFGVLAIGWAIGLLAGSVVLTWIYRGSGRSVLLVAAWHTAFNLTTATEGTGTLVAPLASALVIAGAVWILRQDAATPAVTSS